MHILILGGTGEAAALAERLPASLSGSDRVTYSLAGRTRDPVVPGGTVRRGGFGGVEGLRRYLRDEAVTAVIDATHPYARVMTDHAAVACKAEGQPVLRLQRPAWRPMAGDDWRIAADSAAAATLAAGIEGTVFLTVGGSDLGAFSALADRTVLVRTIDPPPDGDLLPGWTAIAARGPFSVDAETALMRSHDVGVLITKNSGGDAVAAKIAAARGLGVPVVMIERPVLPDMPVVADIESALAWVERLPGPV